MPAPLRKRSRRAASRRRVPRRTGDDRAALADGWRRLGLRTMTTRALPSDTMGVPGRPGVATFLPYQNYEALLGYNCAHNYALSVALLADRLR